MSCSRSDLSSHSGSSGRFGDDGLDVSGSWTVKVSDAVGGDTGILNSWCLVPAFDNTAIFADGFESGDTLAWSD